MSLSLQDIEAFCAVVETGGVNAAARRLGIARSVVSKRIAQLETGLGTQLLHRSTAQTHPTPAGQTFYARASALLSGLEDAANEAREDGDGLSGHLRVTAPVDASHAFLRAPILGFAAAHPHLRLSLDLDDRHVDLAEGGYDVALRIGRLKDSALRMRRLCESPRVLCAAPDYLDRRSMPKTVEDLPDHATLGYANASVSQVWRFTCPDGAEKSVRVRPRLNFNNGRTLAAAAVDGLGICVLPRFVVSDHVKAGSLVEIDLGVWPTSDDVLAVYPPGRAAPAKVRAFIDHMAKALRGDAQDPAGASGPVQLPEEAK